MSRHVRQTLLALTAGAMVQRVLALLLTAWMMRHLGVEGFGEYAFGVQVAALLTLLADGGTRLLVARTIAEAPGAGAAGLRAALGPRLRRALLASAGLAAAAVVADASPGFFCLCALLVPLSVFDLKQLADALGRADREVGIETMATLAQVALTALALQLGGGREALALALVASRGLYAVLAWRWLATLPAGHGHPPALAHAGALGLAQLAYELVFSAPVVVVRTLVGADAAGLMAAAQRIVLAAETPARLLARLLLPHLVHAGRRGDAGATLERAVRASAHVVLPIAAGGWVMAEPLLALLSGPAYAAAAWALRWQLVAAVVVGTLSHHAQAVIARGSLRPYFTAVAAGIALALGLGAATVEPFGATGVAFAGAAAQLVAALVCAVALHRRVPFAVVGPWRRPALHAALVAAAALLGARWGAAAQLGLGAVAFGLGLFLLEMRGRVGQLGSGLQRASGFMLSPGRAAPGDAVVASTMGTFPSRAPSPSALPTTCGTTAVVEAVASVAVVVVNHASSAATAAALQGLLAAQPELPAIVVDNSPDPCEAKRLAAAFGSRVEVVSVVNRGFGAACNVAVDLALQRHPQLDHVWFLNPDTEAAPDALAHMLSTFARHPDAGAVGARLVSLDGRRTLFEHGRIRRLSLTRCHARAPRPRCRAGERPDDPDRRTEFVTGACMLVAADLLRDGLRFDEGYFLYVEDMDLCCTIAARGRSLWVNDRAVVRHAEGGTQDDPPVLAGMRARQLYWSTAGKVRFARKWLAPWQQACFFTVAVLVKPLLGLALARSTRFLPPYFRGLRDGWRAPWPGTDQASPSRTR